MSHRVLMTADAVGGVWSYALELCRGLGAEGVEVVLAVMGPPPDAQQRLAVRALQNVNLVHGPYRLEWQDSAWADLVEAGRWLCELEEHHMVDLVHLNGFVHGALPLHAPKIVVGHSCVLSWWQAVKKEPAPSSWDRYRATVKAGLMGADYVVAPSTAMLTSLQNLYGWLPRTRVIHNGVSPHEYRVGPKQPLVLGVGRVWDEAKNLGALDRVAPFLDWPVEIAGPLTVAGEPPNKRRGPVRAGGALRLGVVDSATLRQKYAAASIYALPARYEPFGLSVLEAALSGAALVLGQIGSLRQLWEEAAYYVDPEDDQSLGAAIASLIARPERRAMLADRARERALWFSATRMVDLYLALYRQLAPRLVGSRRDLDACAS